MISLSTIMTSCRSRLLTWYRKCEQQYYCHSFILEMPILVTYKTEFQDINGCVEALDVHFMNETAEKRADVTVEVVV